MPTHTIKRGDTKPLEVKLRRASGKPVPLAGATVRIRITTALGPVVVDNALCEIVDAAQGHVAYVWGPGETDVAGVYRATFPVTDAAGEVETIPNRGALDLIIE